MRGSSQKENLTQQSNSLNRAKPQKAPLEPSIDAHPILQLQRAIGNQAVLRLLQRERDPDRARDKVIGRQPDAISMQQGSEGDKERLKRLVEEVKATAVGQEFISVGGAEPAVLWGNSGEFDGRYDGDNIILSKAKKELLTDCEWRQVIAMELGNFANAARFEGVYSKSSKGNLSEVEYVIAIEKIEFESRDKVIDAYAGGQFGEGPAKFTKVSFEDYMNAPRNEKHREDLRKQWEENDKKAYLKKHPTEK